MNYIPRKRTLDSALKDRTNDSSLIRNPPKRQRTDRNRSQRLCWQFQRGFCTNVNCRFLHKDDYAPIKRNQTCKFWLQNNYCRFGDRCWYLHSLQCEVIPATSHERERERERKEQPSNPSPSTAMEIVRASPARKYIINMEKEMQVKLWVGNIPWSATEKDISDFFRQGGLKAIKCDLVTHKNGKSRGFAFVTMSIPDARRACHSINGSLFFGRYIKVNICDRTPSHLQAGVISVPVSNMNVDADGMATGKFVLIFSLTIYTLCWDTNTFVFVFHFQQKSRHHHAFQLLCRSKLSVRFHPNLPLLLPLPNNLELRLQRRRRRSIK